MPLTTETTKDCRGIIHMGTGTVTGDELVEASRSALQLVQNTQNFDYEIVDLTSATGLDNVGDEHIEQLTAQDRLAAVFRPNAIVVVIAPRDEFFELGKKWERRVQDLGWSTRVTRDRGEAVEWLSQNYHPSAVS